MTEGIYTNVMASVFTQAPVICSPDFLSKRTIKFQQHDISIIHVLVRLIIISGILSITQCNTRPAFSKTIAINISGSIASDSKNLILTAAAYIRGHDQVSIDLAE